MRPKTEGSEQNCSKRSLNLICSKTLRVFFMAWYLVTHRDRLTFTLIS